MSYSDELELTGWQKIGCIVYSFFGLLFIAFAGLLAVFGDCPAFASPRCEPISEWILNSIFPVTLLSVFVVGFSLLKFFKRD